MVVTLLVLLAILGGVAFLYRPPPPAPDAAPPEVFSAMRAVEVLRRVLGDESPHPVGTPANQAVKERIVRELETLGLTPEVRADLACDSHERCRQVENIVARVRGADAQLRDGPSVMLAAHYDSVPEGPGAADDGAGVAALLEIARIFQGSPPPRSVVFLFDDGEEAGLFGARAYVEKQAVDGVRWVVNLEARGTTGPSLMFETSANNLGLVRKFARGVERPMTSSAYYAVYERMPNDTDLTVFKRAGLSGVNFAFIGGASRYHTADDDLANLDLASLQHQGDNALGLARALASDAPAEAKEPAVFFDLLTLSTIWWPASWTPALAGAAVTVWALAVGLFARARRLSWRQAGWALADVPLLVSIAIAFGLMLQLVWQATGAVGFPPWVRSPAAAIVACWLGGALSSALAPAVLGPTGRLGTWCGVWSWWALATAVSAFLLPEVSFLFLVPLLVAGAAGISVGWLSSPVGTGVLTTLPAAFTAIVWFPHIHLLYDAVGLFAPLAIVLPVSLALSPILPLIAGPRSRWARARIVLAGVFGATSLTAAFTQP